MPAGQAILESGYDSSDVLCSDSVFLTDYTNCLECAGTDNEDIWKYYGSSLTSAAAECGLATTPLSGTQASVGTAEPAVSGGAAAATTTDASASSRSTSAAAVATSTTAAAESSAAVAVTIAAATASATATASTAATTSAAVSSVAYSSVSGSVSGTGSYTTVCLPSALLRILLGQNTLLTYNIQSSSISVVTAGASNRRAAAGLAGVVALGAAYAAVY